MVDRFNVFYLCNQIDLSFQLGVLKLSKVH